ncbi:MAG: ABC transporter substrate-binding protein, partial [Clostridiales Family XIII bacterium]|nr:ABC transporter substrate-binding protein [Clostridiales Family XIII bacterium]
SGCAKNVSISVKKNDANTLKVGVPGSLSTLDINQEAGILNYYVSAIVQEGLVGIDDTGKFIPALATEWTDEDSTVWTFTVREDVKFSDGSIMTADDIIYSINHAMDPELSPGTSIYFPDYVTKVEKANDGGKEKVVITLDGPHPGFIWAVTNSGGLFVTSEKFAEKAGSIGSKKDLILGTGPYKAESFEPGSQATFAVNKEYWGDNDSSYDKIKFDFIEDSNTRLQAFTGGDIDFTWDMPVTQEEQYKKASGATVRYTDNRSYYGITFNTAEGPFTDEHLRKAVSYAIDKDGIVNGIYKGHAEIATAIPAPTQFASEMDKDEAIKLLGTVTHYDFDLAKAKEELAQSGYKDGLKTTITYPDAYQEVGKASLAIAASLKELGIELEVKEIPLEQWLTEIGSGDLGWMIYVPTTGEPGEITTWLLDAQGQDYNPANWTNEEVAHLTADSNIQKDVKNQIDDIIISSNIAGQQAIYAPTFWGTTGMAFSGKIAPSEFGPYTMLSAQWPSKVSAK